MAKVIAAFNMTLDGVADHTAGVANAELHQHYADLISNSGIILYGRKTYQLMQYWQTLIENPSGDRSMDEFAVAIDKIEKLVFTHTLPETGWDSAKIASGELEDEVFQLKKTGAGDVLVGSRSLIIQLLNNHFIDEFQLCIHPVIQGKGMQLFDNIKEKIALKLDRSKKLNSGIIVLYYIPVNRKTFN